MDSKWSDIHLLFLKNKNKQQNGTERWFKNSLNSFVIETYNLKQSLLIDESEIKIEFDLRV